MSPIPTTHGLHKTKMVNGTTTTHVWDGSNIVLEVSGSSVVKYVSGINLIAQITGSTELTYTYYLYNNKVHSSKVQVADYMKRIQKKPKVRVSAKAFSGYKSHGVVINF